MGDLILVCGLPGTGKSTLARRLADELGVVLLTKDVIEAALWRRGVGREQQSFYVAHEVMTALAESELLRARAVVLDTVATTEEVRADWRSLTSAAGSRMHVLFCVCSDEDEHRRRLNGRQRGIPGWPELTWENVESVRVRYEPCFDEHLVLDAMDPIGDNVRSAVDYVRPPLGQI